MKFNLFSLGLFLSLISMNTWLVADSITNLTELYFGEALLSTAHRNIIVNPNTGQSLYTGSAQMKTSPIRGKVDIMCTNSGTAIIDITALHPVSGNLALSDFTFYFSGISSNNIPPIEVEVTASVAKTIYFGAKATYNQNISIGKHYMSASFNLTCP